MNLNINVLVVDDNNADILLFEESLEIAVDYLRGKDILIDYTLDKASDGVEALDLINEKSYSIMFIDIKMPKMDGIECLEKIKKLEIASYVVMFTTSDYDEDIKKTYKLGANGYLLKSLDIMEFEENLKSALLLFIQDNIVYFNMIKDKYKNFMKA